MQMNTRISLAATAALALPGLLLAAPATREYPVQDFDALVVSMDIDVDVTTGPARSVVAEARNGSFEDLRVNIENGVLRIDRPRRSWFKVSRREDYRVRVVTPALKSVEASSDADVTVQGDLHGDFTVVTSSDAEVDIRGLNAGSITARASSGGDIELAGRCVTLNARASSGADIDAEQLQCENAQVEASSGSEISVRATGRISGSVSSGAEVEVYGAGGTVEVAESSGGRVRRKF
jgi:hypothetical protein